MKAVHLIDDLIEALYADALEFDRRGDLEGSTTALELVREVQIARNDDSIERALREGTE